jgi:DNA-binding NarL/FixJ family response regulator
MFTSQNSLAIIIADDHPYFRTGLRQALSGIDNLKCVAEASDGMELCNFVKQFSPDVVLTDISMPVMGGTEAIRHIKKYHPRTGIIAISMHEDVQIIKEVLLAGANAYLSKNADVTEITTAIFSAHLGKFYVSTSTSKYMTHILHSSSQDCAFTSREKEIIQLLYEEFTSSEVGDKLYISKRTVEEHRKNIQKKTGAKNVVGIIKYALKNMIIKS